MQKMGSDSMDGGKPEGKKPWGKKTVQICKQRLWKPSTSSVNQVLNNHGWIEVKETLNMCHTNVVVNHNLRGLCQSKLEMPMRIWFTYKWDYVIIQSSIPWRIFCFRYEINTSAALFLDSCVLIQELHMLRAQSSSVPVPVCSRGVINVLISLISKVHTHRGREDELLHTLPLLTAPSSGRLLNRQGKSPPLDMGKGNCWVTADSHVKEKSFCSLSRRRVNTVREAEATFGHSAVTEERRRIRNKQSSNLQRWKEQPWLI